MSVFDLAANRAALTPERRAVYFDSRWYSYAELDERATKLAGQLYQMGVRQKDRVSILAHNRLAHLDLMLGRGKVGLHLRAA